MFIDVHPIFILIILEESIFKMATLPAQSILSMQSLSKSQWNFFCGNTIANSKIHIELQRTLNIQSDDGNIKTSQRKEITSRVVLAVMENRKSNGNILRKPKLILSKH